MKKDKWYYSIQETPLLLVGQKKWTANQLVHETYQHTDQHADCQTARRTQRPIESFCRL